MVAEHTAGEWELGKGGDSGSVVARSNGPAQRICELYYGSKPLAVVHANGHLIAAAPDLLEMAQAILADGYTTAHRAKLRAVVAKAKGVNGG